MMIQDIYPDRLDNAFSTAWPQRDSCILQINQDGVLAGYSENSIVFPTMADFPEEADCIYLFSVSGRGYYLTETEPRGSWNRYTLQELRKLTLKKHTEIFAVFSGFHLWKWYSTSRYCGSCGGETIFDTAERAKVCRKCGNRIYPRINPAVIVGVKNGDQLLLTRYREGYRHNALIAGFCEIGETVEETVQREVMEEVGLRVRNIQYYRSQPWGIASDLLLGFYCDVDGDDTIHRDENELKYAEWIRREDIILQPSDYSLTNEMMKMFRDGHVK